MLTLALTDANVGSETIVNKSSNFFIFSPLKCILTNIYAITVPKKKT